MAGENNTYLFIAKVFFCFADQKLSKPLDSLLTILTTQNDYIKSLISTSM